MNRNYEDRHHVWFDKKDYLQGDPVLRQLRSRYGLIPTMERDRHNGLHRNVPPPPMPPVNVARSLIQHLDHIHSFDEVTASQEWFLNQAQNQNRDIRERELLQNVANNLIMQLRWIRGGYELEQKVDGGGFEQTPHPHTG